MASLGARGSHLRDAGSAGRARRSSTRRRPCLDYRASTDSRFCSATDTSEHISCDCLVVVEPLLSHERLPRRERDGVSERGMCPTLGVPRSLLPTPSVAARRRSSREMRRSARGRSVRLPRRAAGCRASARCGRRTHRARRAQRTGARLRRRSPPTPRDPEADWRPPSGRSTRRTAPPRRGSGDRASSGERRHAPRRSSSTCAQAPRSRAGRRRSR